MELKKSIQKLGCFENKRKVLWLSVFFIALLSSSSASFSSNRSIRVEIKAPSGKTITLYKNSYALVIGNGDYSLGWDPLPGALADVKDVSAALSKHGFNVTLKTNRPENNSTG